MLGNLHTKYGMCGQSLVPSTAFAFHAGDACVHRVLRAMGTLPRHCAVLLRECHEYHLHLPHTGMGPTQLDHVWFTGLQAVFESRMHSLLTHRLLHPVRQKSHQTYPAVHTM